MKKTNLFIAIICVVLCLLGWFMMVSNNAAQAKEYKEHVSLADSYVKEGLYQRAILEYKAAFKIENNEEIAEKILAAYELRFEEDTEGTFDPFVEDMEMLLGVYPANEKLTMHLAQRYLDRQDYRKAYTWLANAHEHGANSDKLVEMLRTARYAYSVRANNYNAVKNTVESNYVVAKENLWGVYNREDGLLWDCKYSFISQPNEEGVILVTMEKDSRLIDGEGMVLGIFKEKVVDAGIYSDGLVAASTGGKYAYYDEFAKKQFGEYDVAGTFVDGRAAVQKGDKWYLVDKAGESCSDNFAHIVLGADGKYLVNDVMIAASSKGQYKVYDKELNEKADLGKYDAVDIITKDGIIAVCKDGKWGFVNTEGKEIVKPTYEAAHSFSNGLAAVCKDGKWGYINQENIVVIPCLFLKAGYFNSEGAAMVCVSQEEVAIGRDDLITNLDPEGVLEDSEAGTDAEGENEEPELSDETSEYVPDENPLPAVKDPTVIEYELRDNWCMIVLYNGAVEEK